MKKGISKHVVYKRVLVFATLLLFVAGALTPIIQKVDATDDFDWAWSSGSGTTGDLYRTGDVSIGTSSVETNFKMLVQGDPKGLYVKTADSTYEAIVGQCHHQYRPAGFVLENRYPASASFPKGVMMRFRGMDTNGVMQEYLAFIAEYVTKTAGAIDGDCWIRPVKNGGANWAFRFTHDGKLLIKDGGVATDLPSATLDVHGGLLCQGSTGSTPVSGAGTRLMWIPSKAAFRAGYVSGSKWDDVNIGLGSVAMGYDNLANNPYAIALGYQNSAGKYAVAMGYSTSASGENSTAIGYRTQAKGDYSTAMGYETETWLTGDYATAMGYQTDAIGRYSTAMGYQTTASDYYATAMGQGTVASGDNGATAMGSGTVASGMYATAMGVSTVAGFRSTAMGNCINVSGSYSVGIGLDYSYPKWNVTDDHVMSIMGGDIGIGTTSPEALLHLKNNTPMIKFEEEDCGNKKWHIGGYSSGLVLTETGVADRLYIEQGGDVGIGTTTPDTRFEVQWSENADVEIGRGVFDTDITFISLRSPDGSKWYLYPDNSGNLVVTNLYP